jgi:hypothetical protein
VRVVVGAIMLVACGRVGFRAGARDAAIAPDAAPPPACSDGTRDAYGDAAMFPRIAGCLATWPGAPSLRDPPIGSACGNDLGPCVVPADACGSGWHVCARSGDVTELHALTADQCREISGRFVAASDHCLTFVDPTCTYPAPGQFACLAGAMTDCIQPICCGSGCDDGTGCPDGVWPGQTEDSVFTGSGCGSLPTTDADGVLCCED